MKWDLQFFYNGVDDPQIEKDIQFTLKKAEAFESKYKEKLKGQLTTELIDEMLQEQEEIERFGARVAQFSSLLFSENTQNTDAQKLVGRVETVMAEVERYFSFINPTLLTHNDEELQRVEEGTASYSWVIERVRERKTHTLSAETEQILAVKSATGRDNLGSLYSKVTSAYMFEMEMDGEKKQLNNSQMRNLRYSPNTVLRREAMKKLLRGYEKDKTIITGLYNNIAKDYDIESRIRNYKNPVSMRNMANETEDEIVEKLIETTVNNTELVARFYSWKSKKMELDLELADIYAPLEQVKREYSFEEAKSIVIDTYFKFHEKAGKIVESFFEENRIHSDVLPGKNGGAFCSYYIPNGKPFVLLNHNNSISDVLTMAHELGHGLHGTLSAKQTMLNYHTPLTMAEIASVFGEFLVFDRLVPTLSAHEKQLFLASTIEGNFATTFRQNMFARFELKSHEMISKNGFASWDDLSQLYDSELKIMFSNSVSIPEEYKWEWATIPHIFNVPFYVYAYNFANLLVIALYEKYIEEGEKMIPYYFELLESGGSDRPDRLLAKLGIDLKDEAFWQRGFDYIGKLMDQLEQKS